jgi:succinate dehydrogenase / fumarate reductase, flavoprotein subunit
MARHVESVDVLVIGAGAAGLRVAMELVPTGARCLVVGKRAHGDAHTRLAEGGINAVLGSMDPEDRWELHAADTVKEGHFLCDPNAVARLARESPARVQELADWGCPFDRTADGTLAQRFFGAQTHRRTCYVGDCTGEAILRTLVDRAAAVRVPYREGFFVTGLLVHEGRVQGAIGFDCDGGGLRAITARATVLAAGGSTAAYARSSSRPGENTGDAAALAYRAGAKLRDMELVQFHPTGMVWPEEKVGTLVTEAVRGEGAHLHNAHGERFMRRHSPEHLELDARDVVARAIYEEIQSGRGTDRGGVLLDLSHVDAPRVREKLPRMVEQFRAVGVDITREPMEVAPTAHYAMGGVDVDFDSGATTVPGLFAVGEATAGLHGANRLGGNSLAETVVFGRVVGAHLASHLADMTEPTMERSRIDTSLEALERAVVEEGHEHPGALRSELGDLLWRRAGIVRTAEGLDEGMKELRELQQRAHHLSVDGDLRRLEQAMNLRFLLVTAEALLLAARLRKESRGAHYRKDAPEADPAWQHTLLLGRGSSGNMEHRTRPIAPLPRAIEQALGEARGVDYHLLE